jgi:transcriptional regulator with XRE-family HTH domain
MQYEKILERIRQARKTAKKSIRAVAKEMDVSPQMVSFWERGLTPLRIKDFLLLCQILQISPCALMSNECIDWQREEAVSQLRRLPERDFQIAQQLIFILSTGAGTE